MPLKRLRPISVFQNPGSRCVDERNGKYQRRNSGLADLLVLRVVRISVVPFGMAFILKYVTKIKILVEWTEKNDDTEEIGYYRSGLVATRPDEIAKILRDGEATVADLVHACVETSNG